MPAKKSVIKVTPKAKTAVPVKKVKKQGKIQTAEGWKRMMIRKRSKDKKAK